MPFPVIRHQNSAQVRMVSEPDAEHIEHLALVPICRTPHGGGRIDRGILAWQAAFQAQALIARDRMQMIDHLEARLGRIAVYCRHGAQSLELPFILEKAASLDQLFRSKLDCQLPESFGSG